MVLYMLNTEMLSTVKLINTPIITHTCLRVCVVKISPLSKFQVYNTTLLAIITLWSVRPSELIYLV